MLYLSESLSQQQYVNRLRAESQSETSQCTSALAIHRLQKL